MSGGAQRVERIRQYLTEAFTPLALEIEDQSHRHRGHAGAADGRGHFHVLLVTEAFIEKPRLARHRAVYRVLAEMLESDIHALSLDLFAPGER